MRADLLFIATVGYLLLPEVVFAAGWLRPAWGCGIVLVLLACFVAVARGARTDVPRLAGRDWAAVAALAVFWTVAGGIGEFNLQVSDYIKHNLLFHDLIVERWPVVYGAGESGGQFLCYYVAYYLPVALAAKLTGLQTAALWSLGWGALGVVLSFAWVARFGRPHGAVVLALFTLVDGLCWMVGLGFLASRVASGAGPPAGGWLRTDGFTFQFWDLAGSENRLLFHSEPSMLMWTPQHAIAAWLATACVLSVLWERRRPAHAGLVTAAVALWSPFVAVGLSPFTVAAVWRRGRPDVSWADVAGGAVLAAAVGSYFLAHLPQRFLGILPAALPDAVAWAKYALFLGLAIGGVFGAVWLVQRRHALLGAGEWLACRIAGASLLAATVVTMGKYNDWAMRVSMPGLFVLHLTAAAVAVRLWRSDAVLRHRLAFAAVVLLASERPLKAYVLLPVGRLGGDGLQTTIATARTAAASIAELRDGRDRSVAAQYLGSTTSFFGRHLMRRLPACGSDATGGSGGERRER